MMKAFLVMGEKFSFGNAMGEAVGPLNTAWGMTGAPFGTRPRGIEKKIWLPPCLVSLEQEWRIGVKLVPLTDLA